MGFGGYIPKYQVGDGEAKKWWKYQSGFQEDPNFTSRVELKEMKRHLAKPDKLKIYHYTNGGAPPEYPFKEEHHKIEDNHEKVADKVTEATFWKYPKDGGQDHGSAYYIEGGDKFDPQYHLTKGFSEAHNPFQHKPGERLMDKVMKTAEKLADLEEFRNKVDSERRN